MRNQLMHGGATWNSKVNRKQLRDCAQLLGKLVPAILALAFVHDLTFAYGIMIAIGLCGSTFVVPLNALLQERGHESIGAGNALAVQNFAENIAMLLFLGAYSWATAAGVSVTTSIIAFGSVMLLVIGTLALFRLKRA